jgi:hypothetical protein
MQAINYLSFFLCVCVKPTQDGKHNCPQGMFYISSFPAQNLWNYSATISAKCQIIEFDYKNNIHYRLTKEID